MRNFAPVVVRIGVSLVFLWFGINQIATPELFVGYVPAFFAGKASLFLLLNGIFQTVFAAMLLVGLFTRFVSFVLVLCLIGIIYSVGYNEIGVRDFGLLMATISICMNGSDALCLEKKIGR